MKGLLRRDIYLAGQYLKMMPFIWVFSFFFCLGMKNNTYGMMMALVFDISIILNTMAVEARGGWAYFLACPVSRNRMVREKYLYCLGMHLMILIAGAIPGIVSTLVWHLSWEDFILFWLIGLGYGFYLCGAILPLCYKLRMEMMQGVAVGAMLLPFLLIVLAMYWVERRGYSQINFETVCGVGTLCVGVLLIFWIMSYFLSVRIFQKREIQ